MGGAVAVKGVTKSGGGLARGWLLVTSTGFRAYLCSSQSISTTAIPPTDRYARLRFHHGAACVAAVSVGRKAGERSVARTNPRKVANLERPVVFDPRVSGSLVGHLVGAVSRVHRRRTSFLKPSPRRAACSQRHLIIDDPARPALASLRRRFQAVIDEGADFATARELGMITTGR